MRGWLLFLGIVFSGAAWAKFSPYDVKLSCGADVCPPQVGLIVFFKAVDETRVELYGCTGFLMADLAVMGNSHCDYSNEMEGYFINLVDGVQRARKITGVTGRHFTPGFEEEGRKYHSGRPDVLTFQIKRGFPNVSPLKIAQGAGSVFGKVEVIAARSTSAWEYTIERHICEVRRHGVYFPFGPTDSPDVLAYFGCRLGKGNSGAPGFALGGTEVEFIHFSDQDPELLGAAIRRQRQREPVAHERHWLFQGANARCLAFEGHAGAACEPNTSALANARMHKEINRIYQSLEFRRPGFQGLAYPLKGSDPAQMQYEIFFRPTCRAETDPRTIPIYFEHVAIQIGPWAEVSLATRTLRVARGQVESRTGDRLTIRMVWPMASGELTNLNQDIRRAWGERFTLDLPVCAR